MKRVISIFISILLLMSSFTVITAFAEVQTYRKNGYLYTFRDYGVQILRYYGKASNVTIPAEIDGKKVVKIGVDNTEDKEYIYDSLDYMGFSGNEYVKTVTVPGGIKKFGINVFRDCKNLKKVVFKNGIKEIAGDMFSGCIKLQSVSIPKTVTCIGGGAFSFCKKLKVINLPSSVTRIYDEAFYKSGLTKFHVGKNIKSMLRVGNIFYGTKIKKITVSKNNKKYCEKKGVLYNKKKTTLIYYPCKKSAKSFTVPNTVTKISEEAFKGNKYLKSIVISKNVQKIGDNAFRECQKLVKVKFKNKKQLKINYSAFLDCKSLKTIIVPKNVVKIGKAFGYYIANTKNFKTKKIKGFTIKGYKGTAASKYAKKYGFKFVALN